MPPRRREFLITAGLAAAVTGLAGCTGKGQAPGINTPRQPVTLPVAEVPRGSGVILKNKGYVVVQPTEGEFKAFSAICPHQGCEVSNIVDRDIVCGCHGSRFALADGSVKQGPATTGLGPAKVSRDGDTLTVEG